MNANAIFLSRRHTGDAENNFNTSSGKALIGGSWELTDLDGKKISHERFANKWYLLYFGFTHCPDVCPDELEKISGVMDTLGK